MPPTVEFGRERLAFPDDPARLVAEWHGPIGRVGDEVRRQVLDSLETPIGFPALRLAVVPGDRVAIAVGPDVPEAAEILRAIVEVLTGAGAESVQVLVASPLADSAIPAGARQAVHDPDDRENLAYLAATQAGRRIYLDRRAVDADLLVAVGRLGDDPSLGETGPWAAVFPGLADAPTLKDSRSSLAEVGAGPTPLGREATEVCWLLGSQFQIGAIAGRTGVAGVVAGLEPEVRAEGMKRFAESWTFHVPRQADLVVVGVGNSEQKATSDDLAAALATASALVRRGGKIAVLCPLETLEGPAMGRLVGLDDPRSAPTALKGAEGSADFPAASRIARALAWADVYLFSGLPEDVVEDLGMVPLARAEEAVRLASQSPSWTLASRAEITRASVAEED